MRRVHRTLPARTTSVLALSLLAFSLTPAALAAPPVGPPEPTSTTDPAPAATTAAGDPAATTSPAPTDPAELPADATLQDPTTPPDAAAGDPEPLPAPTADPAPLPAPPDPAVTTPPAAPAAPAAPEPEAQYVVLYVDGTDVDAEADELRADGTVVEQTFTEAPAAVVTLTPSEATALAGTAGVEAVEPDAVISALETQPNAPWGLDRTDQRNLPLSGTYSPPSAASGVTVYVVDSGVSANVEFGGRVAAGWTSLADGRGTLDCHGHGTHIAGTIAGTTYGVAKGATIVPVRILGCDGKGTLSDRLAGIDWITAHHGPGAPAVANLSLGGVSSPTLDTALQRMIQDGVTTVVAAGNDSVDACSVSPARVPQAITVAASDSQDRQATFTNVGACVDLYAPGVLVLSAGHASPTATALKSGTSTATPHVSGAAALLLAENPAASPGQVADALIARSTGNVVSGVSAGTPNRLLFVQPAGGASPAAPAASPPSGINTAPLGVVDSITASSTSVTVRGWALDPDTTASIPVHVYVGPTVTAATANGHRPDVEAIYRRGAAHGYDLTVPAAPGTHQVCVYAINATPGVNPLLGCRTVTV